MCHRTHSACLCLDLLVLFHFRNLPERGPAAQQLQDGQRAFQDHCTYAPQRHQQHPALLRQRREDGRPAAESRAGVREPAGGIRTHRHEGRRVQWGREGPGCTGGTLPSTGWSLMREQLQCSHKFHHCCNHLLHFGFFFQNLVRAGSALLDPDKKEHWDQIQKTEGGTAHLLRNFEEYANTLAQNVRKTYLKPFTIVTDNMSEWSGCDHTNCDHIWYISA